MSEIGLDRDAGVGCATGPSPNFGGESKCSARPPACRGLCEGECGVLDLPARRPSVAFAPRINGPDGKHRVHVTVGRAVEDGSICEVWIDMHREGTALRSFSIALGRLASLAMRRGAPVELVVQALAGIEGAPAGDVEDAEGVTKASSVPDLVAQILDVESRARGSAST